VDTNVLKVDTTLNRVGILTATPNSALEVAGSIRTTNAGGSAAAATGVFDYVAGTTTRFVSYGANTSTAGAFQFTGLSSNASVGDVRYGIDATGVHSWQNVGGVAGTAMTLNSTGLGVGTSATSKLTIKPSASSSGILEVLTGSTNTDSLRVSGGGTVNSWLELRGYLGVKLYSDATNTVTVDSAGNCGIGVTPSAWTSSVRAIDIVSGGLGVFSGGITHNAYFDNTDARWEYKVNGSATYYNLQTGIHQWFVAASGTANNPITTFATASMTLDASGNLLVGTTSLAGSSSNATAVILGSARTANGSVSTTTAVASTIFSITAALRGRYEVVALIANSGSPASYTSVASVIWDGNGGRVVANNGTNLTITLSGSDVQVTQTSGSAQTVFWSFLRVALA
jgi:hypothetical protein